MVCMKHVGLNVAADGFVNAAITGVGGGLVVAVADDPSMHSSQNEQDSRFYAQFAQIPSFEPSSQQEAYDMAFAAMDLSEELRTPVLIRLTTRLSHSRANITRAEVRPENEVCLPADPRRFVLLPSIAKTNFDGLVARQPQFVARSEASSFNSLADGPDHSLGILATGIAYNYVMENFGENGCPYPVLKVSQYPLPVKQIRQLLETCDRVLLAEEGAPFVEAQLHGPLGLNDKIIGRMTGALPRTGELNPRLVAKAMGLETTTAAPLSELARPRPPRLCAGCSHIDSYHALNEVMAEVGKGRVFSDIGCYTLGALPPFEAISSCVDMGASISMAKGAADAGLGPSVAVIGDSTFTHSGMTPLLDCVWENSNVTVFLLDNGTTGMTGGQDSLGTGRMAEICEGIGVPKELIREFVPLKKNHAENVRILREEIIEYQGLSVVIAFRECVQTLRRKKKKS
ncbi:MAG: indolepyruvate ferredoxin oxidoreductase, partial [Lentisphaeria bacterium]|nr:indolepyruvate ferredoxin oxidoreductase [Lentisphaeria bacterium]